MNAVEILKKLVTFPTNTLVYDNGIKEFILSLLKKQAEKIITIPDTINRSFLIKLGIGQSKKRPLVFLCHLDTIIPTNQWFSNPFAPEIKGNKIFGLGTSDMKGSVAAVIKGVLGAKKINRTVYLAFTSDEESQVKDVEKLAKVIKLKNAIVVAPEPTGGNIRIGQKGVLELRITMPGESHHAARATRELNKKDNAIYKIGSVINLIKRLEATYFNQKVSRSTTFNLGRIEGGTVVNNMADSCSLEISCRVCSSLAPKKLLDILEKGIKRIEKKATINLMLLGSPFFNDNKRDLLTLREIIKRQGQNPHVLFGKAWSEITSFDNNGNSCFVIGPGEPNQAHHPNEFIRIDKLNKFCEVYSNILDYLE